MKPVPFHPKALNLIRGEEPDIRKQIGEALGDLQKGIRLGPPLSRPMPTVAAGVSELRVRGKTAAIRVFYFVKLPEAIVVFHAFLKDTEDTGPRIDSWSATINRGVAWQRLSLEN